MIRQVVEGQESVVSLLARGQLRMTSGRERDVHTLALEGELDLATVDGVAAELERVEATDVVSIVVDLGGVTFIDSSGVRLCMQAASRARGADNRLVLLRGSPLVQRVFDLCGVTQRLPFAG